jgi:1-aminocyclopropane-1-carboxylate deaminase/D-cysteine desulfhydrase-like pyridoxal-dependent ACC family enzyme
MLTPVEEHNGIYYKRDDLYCPWGDVNGGKVRQAIRLFENKRIYDWPGVVAAVSVHSPTGPVISRVAKEFNTPCIIAVGGTKVENLDILPMMRLTRYYGAEVRIVAGHGMKNAINARVNEICEETGYHNIDFSHHIYNDTDLMFNTNSTEVLNIPNELDVLVMSLGVGIQFACVLKGLKKHKKKVKRIIGVQVGPDRRKLIDGYLNQNPLTEPRFDLEYELVQYKSAYSKPEIQKVSGFYLDDIYEAKAHKWMLKNINKNQKTLFWCVGRRLTSDEVEHICTR